MPYVEISPEEAISTQGKFIPISEGEALKAKKPTSPLIEGLSEAYETIKSIGTVWGPAEVGAELVSGIPGFIAGGITSGVEAVSGKKIPYVNKLVELLESPYVTYKPKTESGKQLENALANIFITARETGQNVADVVLEKTGSPLLSTITGTATGGIPEILMGIAGIKRGLRPKVKAPSGMTEADWAELKKPPPEQLEYKPKVEPRTLEVPSELQTKALSPGQGFIILDEKPKTILREPPPGKGREVLISPEGEPIYPEGVKPVLGKLPLTETEKMKAPVITKEGETIGVKPELKTIEQPKLEVVPPEAKVEVPKYRPAYKVGDQTIIGEPGEPHFKLEEKLPKGWWNKKTESGWVDEGGNWIPTEKTWAIRPELTKPEPKVEALKPTEPLPIEKVSPEAPPVKVEGVKQPWEMKFQDYETMLRNDISPEFPTGKSYLPRDQVVHKQAVQQALSEGKTVPPEVLKDYPDLVKPEAKIEGIKEPIKTETPIEYSELVGRFEEIKEDMMTGEDKPWRVEYRIEKNPKSNEYELRRKSYAQTESGFEFKQDILLDKAYSKDKLKPPTESDWQKTERYGYGKSWEAREKAQVEYDQRLKKLIEEHSEITFNANKEYETELKKGKIYGKAKTNQAPQEQIDAIKTKLEKKWKETLENKTEEIKSFKGNKLRFIQGIAKDILKSEEKQVPEKTISQSILKSEKGAIQIPTVEEIKRVTNRFKEFWSPFSTLPQKENLLKIRGEAFGGMARTERIVDRAINLTKGLSDQAKKDIFESIDMARKDINTLPPEQARIAKEFIAVNNIIGKMLVERGLIAEDTYRSLKGQYIKYAYLKHMLGESIEIPINPNGKINTNVLKARKGLTLEQQKAIGFIEDVSIAQPLGMAQSLSNIVKYDYLEKLASDPRNVWEPSIINISDMPRKYSESIAKAQATRLSRSTGDPHRAIQVGNDWQVMNLQNREFVGKKMGIGELNEEVDLYKKMVKANPNSPEIKQRLGVYERYLEQAKVATQNVPADFIQMPTAKSWGPLAGSFLRKEVARDLMSFYGKERGNIQGLTKAIDALVDIDQKATGLFKIGKVPLNLPTVVRNTISNPIQLNMSGMNYADIIKNMVRTGEDFIKKSPTYTKASRAGLFKTNWSVTEINEVMDQFRHLKGDTFADVVGAMRNLSKYYGRIDDFFKYTKLLDGLDNGLSFDKAIQEGQKWGMDYSLAEPSIKWARKHAVPFISYQYKIAPLVAESVIKRPWVIAKYMALPPAIMALAKELYKDEMTEEDWEGLKKTIPAEVQRRQSSLIVPWKIKDKWYWFDYSYFLPWGNYMNAISAISSGDIKAPLTQFGIGGTPALTTLKTFSSSAMRNEPPKDSFSGYPLYNRLDEPIDKALKVSEYFYNLFAPSMVTRYGALGDTLDIGKEDRYGRTVEAEQAIGKWVGINLKEANPKLAAIIKKAKINALKDEYMKIMIDPNISTEKKEGYAERFQEEIGQIMKGKD